MPDYPKWDQRVAVTAAQNTTNILGGRDSSGKLVESEESIIKRIDLDSVAGHSSDQLATIESLFKEKINEYLEDTENIIILNDLANINNFANQTVDKETKRLSDLRQRTNSDLIKLKQKYLNKKYTVDYNKFLVVIIKYTFSIVIVVSLLTYCYIYNKINSTLYFVLLGFLAFLYMFVIVIMIKNQQHRRKDDWNKFYFFKSN